MLKKPFNQLFNGNQKVLDKLKIDLPLEEIASKLKYKNLDELLLHIGSGSLNSPKLVKKLTTLINYGERKNISFPSKKLAPKIFGDRK